MSEWKKFEVIPYGKRLEYIAPYDKRPFLACIWGYDSCAWVAQAVYVRCYDAQGRTPSKYDFIYVAQFEGNSEKIWEIKLEEDPFPITHWMPLPNPPEVNYSNT
jgi:hypothetical protein